MIALTMGMILGLSDPAAKTPDPAPRARRAAPLGLSPAAAPTAASAPEIAPSSDQPVSRTAPQNRGADHNTDPAEVVISAKRDPHFADLERQYGAGELTAHGADTIDELLYQLGIKQSGDGQPPLVLIDGKLVGMDRSTLGYPPEALEGVGVLRPDAGARFGAAPGQRVINLTLKRQFTSRDGGVQYQGATRGGLHRGSLSAGQQMIAGPNRWHIQAQVQHDSGLLASARRVVPRSGPVDLVGYVTGIGDGELDPVISARAGRLVTLAAFPDIGRRTLADFAETAGQQHAADPTRFETLRSRRDTASIDLGWSRPIGRWSINANLNGAQSTSTGLRGLAMVRLTLPADHWASPFSRAVAVVRPLNPHHVLRQTTVAHSVNAMMTLNGSLWDIQTSLTGQYGWTRSDARYERGVDQARVRALLSSNDPALDPFSPWSAALLRTDRTRTDSRSYSLIGNFNRALFSLPAGRANLTVNVQINHSETDHGASVGPLASDRTQHGVDAALALPLLPSGGRWGALNLTVRAGGQQTRGQPVEQARGADLNWTVSANLSLSGRWSRIAQAPTFDQLHAPMHELDRSLYDVARQDMATIVWQTGGNPALRNGTVEHWAVQAAVRPFAKPLLRLETQLQGRSVRDGVSALPELTPMIEAAFPDRFIRDGAGRLVAVDARAINFGAARELDLMSTLELRLLRARDSAQASLRINHVIHLERQLLSAPGAPMIDQLADNGQSRHRVHMSVSAGTRQLGFDLSGQWSSPARLAIPGTGGGTDQLRFSQPWTVRLNLHLQPGALWPGLESRVALLKQTRVTLDIDNLFDSYRHARFANGQLPTGYTRDDIDPVGRMVRVALRKRF